MATSEQRDSETRTVMIDSGGETQEIAYRELGDGDVTVFLLHGVTANHLVWDPIQVELARNYRVIAVDQRGHGNSGKPATGYRAEHYSNDIAGLVVALGGGRPSVLVGHSLGARNSIVAGARFPQLVAGLVAIDFTPHIETEVFDTLEQRVSGGDQRFDSVAEIEAYLHARYPLMPHDAVQRRAAYGYRLADKGYVALADPHAMRETVAGLREDLAPSLAALTAPAVIVRGAESVLVTEQAFESSRSLRPDLSYETVPRADHYVPEEEPAAIAAIVTAFVDELSS